MCCSNYSCLNEFAVTSPLLVSQIEDTNEAVMILEEITEMEENVGVLEVTITTTLLEELTMDVTQAQDRNVI